MNASESYAAGLVVGALYRMAAEHGAITDVHPVVNNGDYTQQATFMMGGKQFVVSINEASTLT